MFPHSPSETLKVELGFCTEFSEREKKLVRKSTLPHSQRKSLKEPTLYCFGSPKEYKAEATSRCFGGNKGLLGAEAS